MSPQSNASLAAALAKLGTYSKRLRPYAALGFLAFTLILYGFVMFRVSSLSNAQPSEDAVSSQVKAAKLPKIQQSVISQLQSLQDNSVNVKTLFSEARNNPFQ